MKKITQLLHSLLTVTIIITLCTGHTAMAAPAINPKAVFSGLPGFSFASGVGAWGTELTINPDGTFYGDFHDWDPDFGENYPNGTVYVCSFSGRFEKLTKLSDFEYSMQVAELDVEKTEGEEWISEGTRYIASTPYGMDNAGEFRLYFPGIETASLPSEYVEWVSMPMAWGMNGGTPYALPFYGLYNVGGQQGYFGTMDTARIPAIETKHLMFWAADREMSVDVEWGDGLFTSDSSVYSADLALVSSVLSMAAYNRENANQNAKDVRARHGFYIEDAYRKLGFAEEKIKLFSYPGHPKNQTGYKGLIGSDDDLAFAIADKTITVGDSDYNLILVTLRGTGGKLGYILNGEIGMSPDWQRDIFGNFQSRDFLDTKVHSGFYGFYEDLHNALEQYQQINGLTDIAKNKVLITGHSLGAAGSNLLAAHLSFDQSLALKENIYCYTFATPNCVLEKGTWLYDFDNIFNIVNPKDGVTGLPASLVESFGILGPRTARAWKYGVVCALPSDTRSGISTPYETYKESFTTEMAILLGNSQTNLFPTRNHILFGSDHDPEFYVAWMKTRVPMFEEVHPGDYTKYVRAARWDCPVDIEIFDSTGVLVGRISDNAVDYSVESDLVLFVEGDSKYAVLPEGEYSFHLTGTGNGTMTFTLEELYHTGEEETGSKLFKNVQLSQGKRMLSEIGGDTTAQKTRLFVLDDSGAKTAEVLADGSEAIPDTKADTKNPLRSTPSNILIALLVTITICAGAVLIGFLVRKKKHK